jgi:hypothetical protein
MKYLPFILFSLIFACKSDPKSAPNADVFKTIFVNSQKVLCKGASTQFCLQIRDSSEQNWKLWYEPIKDFMYEEGFKYEIKVIERKVEKPATGASPIQYLLVREIRKIFDEVMSLHTPEDIDTWFGATFKSLESVEPIKKEITKGNQKINVAVYAQSDKPILIRANLADGTMQEYYFYKTEVVLLRELIPGIKPIENRFYFNNKNFVSAKTRQSVGKMATDGIHFSAYKAQSGKEDFRMKFNSVMQEAYFLFGAK